jgi:hypothetical protein
MLTVIQIENHYEVRVQSSNKLVGRFIQDVDGFFYFAQEEGSEGGGLWSDYSLLEIGSKLREINRPWIEYIESDFLKSKNNKSIDENFTLD